MGNYLGKKMRGNRQAEVDIASSKELCSQQQKGRDRKEATRCSYKRGKSVGHRGQYSPGTRKE
jgi:hypothetical protein